jgi:FkbM family methyltransferase
MEPTSLSRRLLWWVTRRKGALQMAGLRLARAYVHAVRDYSYNCDLNGEAWLLQQLSGLQVGIVFDVGANVGDWARLARRSMPLASIHAFELSDSIRSTLRERVSDLRVEVAEAALADHDGDVQHKDFGGCSGLNTIVTATTHHDWRSPTVKHARVMRGDAYCRAAGVDRIDLLKVDVEGFEGAVLQGFGEMLSPDHVRCIQFEYGYGNGDTHWLMKDFAHFLAQRGYVVGKLWHDGVAFTPFEYSWNDFESGPNYVAVGREDFGLQRLVARSAPQSGRRDS